MTLSLRRRREDGKVRCDRGVEAHVKSADRDKGEKRTLRDENRLLNGHLNTLGAKQMRWSGKHEMRHSYLFAVVS